MKIKKIKKTIPTNCSLNCPFANKQIIKYKKQNKKPSGFSSHSATASHCLYRTSCTCLSLCTAWPPIPRCRSLCSGTGWVHHTSYVRHHGESENHDVLIRHAASRHAASRHGASRHGATRPCESRHATPWVWRAATTTLKRPRPTP